MGKVVTGPLINVALKTMTDKHAATPVPPSLGGGFSITNTETGRERSRAADLPSAQKEIARLDALSAREKL